MLYKKRSNGTYKHNRIDVTHYRTKTKFLSNGNIPWFRYEIKHNRKIKVMIKKFYHSGDTQSKLNDLKDQDCNVLNAINKLNWKTNEPLDMSLVVFDTTEDIKKVHQTKIILSTVVKVELIKDFKIIPQYKNCKAFGRTRNVCGKP